MGAAFETVPVSAAAEAGFTDAAEALAHATRARAARGPVRRRRAGLQRLEADIREAYRRLETSALMESVGAEWLLDNRHLVLGACTQVRIDLTRGFFASLPKTNDPGTTRIEVIARELMDRAGGFVDRASIERFLAAYQRVSVLSVGELWALPAFLRVAALEAIIGAVQATAEDVTDEGWGERVSTAVLCLRSLEVEDWNSVVEALSMVDRCLRKLDPSGTYAEMDFPSRDRYRKAVEELARWGGRSELGVAQAAVKACRGPEGAGVHVGEVLVGPGRRGFERGLGIRCPLGRWLLRLLQHGAGGGYIAAVIVLTGLLTAAMVAPLWRAATPAGLSLLVTLIALVPTSTAAMALANAVVTRLMPPRSLLKLDLSEGLPARWQSCVAVPALLGDLDEVETLLRGMEVNYLANRDPNLRFALLADPPDADVEVAPRDEAVLEAAVDGIRALNRRHGGAEGDPFFLFWRSRTWNPRQGRWMAWERKRGKLERFNRFLATGQVDDLTLHVGDADALRKTVFVLTLDADTRLPTGAAARLVGALAHPLNRARWGPDGRVTRGYTVLQPRIETQSPHPATFFNRIFQTDEGLDLYSRAVSDVYQDLFQEGIYAGKGIYDVAAFQRSMEGRVPPDAILSHDLFEGVLGRAGLVSDVAVLEDFPVTPGAYMRRYHRWVRGDWQLLPWLRRRVPAATGHRIPNRLSWLAQWKILDNLRRSLLAPALLALLLSGWILLPGGTVWWTAWCVWLLAVPVLLPTLRGAREFLSSSPATAPFGPQPRVRWAVGRWALGLVFLPWEAWVVMDAVARTLFRLCVSRRLLLEWTPAAYTSRALAAAAGPRFYLREMGWSLLAVAAVLGGAAGAGALSPGVWISAGAVWGLSPVVAWVLGRVPSPRERSGLTEEEVQELRLHLRRGWAFFERYAGPEDHWLPPDHVQFDPPVGTAHRTSPTNIGLALVATQVAFDGGHLSPRRHIARLTSMLDSLDRLERYRGHLLNWYDTRRLAALAPRYVSTVDSGNLAACLLAVAGGLRNFIHEPLSLEPFVRGLADDLDLAAEHLGALGLPDDATVRLASELRGWARSRGGVASPARGPRFDAWHSRLREIEEEVLDFLAGSRPAASEVAEARWWLGAMGRTLAALQEEWEALLPWQAALREAPAVLTEAPRRSPAATAWRALWDAVPEAPVLRDLPALIREIHRQLEPLRSVLPQDPSSASDDGTGVSARAWVDALEESLAKAEGEAEALMLASGRCAARMDGFARGMDFRFLFDGPRKLFHVGYNADAMSLDPSYYDLFASEARLASYVAIMLGQVPEEHWLTLRRPFRRVNGSAALLSWGGSMFEYLLPSLFLRTPDGSLSEQACEVAVEAQMRFARGLHIPWGVSESAYGETDQSRRYRYRAFGVPCLSLHRDSTPRIVMAPYAVGLAMAVAPRQALAELRRARSLGLEGPVGYYDAADFGESGEPRTSPRVVRTVMAHHQGMLLAGLHHALTGGTLVERFHQSSEAQSLEYLLHERAPGTVRVVAPPPRARARPARPAVAAPIPPWPVSPDAFPPESTVLSNGRLSALLTASGGGGLRWEGYDVYRWRPDPTCASWGEWGYVVDRNTGQVHSVARAPTWGATEREEVFFGEGTVEFHRDVGPLRLRTRITIAPSVDVEIRQVGVVNESSEPRVVEVTSLAEIALARPSEDRRHPAFARLFAECDPDPRTGTLWFTRRSEGLDGTPLCVGHRLTPVAGDWSLVGWEVDRERFFGRLGDSRAPRGVRHPSLSRAHPGAWAPIDPVASVTARVTLPPGGEAVLEFLTGVGHRRAPVEQALETLRSPGTFALALNHTRDRQRRLRQRLGVEAHEPRLFQSLIGRLAFPYGVHPLELEASGTAEGGQEFLWSLGVSGDRPVVTTVRAPEGQGPLLRQLLRALPYLASRNLEFDLVVVGREQDAYGEPVRRWIEGTLREMGLLHLMNAPGGVFYLPRGRVSPAAEVRLREASTLFLGPEVQSLEAVLSEDRPEGVHLPAFVPVPTAPLETRADAPLEALAGLRFRHPWGGHAPRGRSVIVELESGDPTPGPWSNVLSNPEFGTLVTESGGGYTWAGNAGESRVTPFANDPVFDPAGEIVYLRDEETGAVWTPTPRPAGASQCRVTHRAEESVFKSRSHGLDQRLRVWVPAEGSAKVFELRVADQWSRARRVTVTLYVEWVLGNRRSITAPHLVTCYDPQREILRARSPFSPGRHPRVGFVAADQAVHGFTCDRQEFLGPEGDRARPAGLLRVGLAGSAGGGLDPCAALQVHLDLPAGGRAAVRFFLGAAHSVEEVEGAVARLRTAGEGTRARLAVRRRWRGWFDQLVVRTPDPAMDVLLNSWLLHQTIASRIWGRTGYYQSSGAFGFRDQLQDSLALLHQAPALCRERILDAARHQFQEGDVLHWWHPPEDRGVRTRCSDDRLWLPYVTAHYLAASGDAGVLDESVPFLTGPALENGETERYDAYPPSGEGSLYEHCMRALELDGILSPRGLPLLGSGDWNDGLNQAGVEGRGESVWLAWFLYDVLGRFAPLCRERGAVARAQSLEDRAEDLREAVERIAWDGGWYLRGTYDDGFPLGSTRNEEGRIDSLPQTWAVLSGAADEERARTAMEAVWRELVDKEARIVRLLKPPFHLTRRSPGYIKSYPPGVRENGGQYTHAATWVGWAFARLGDGDRAEEVFRILNPLLRPGGDADGRVYRVEPYVVAGDVYGDAPHLGRGGWTWYTGSAAWLYRLGIEGILGLYPVPGGIRLQPCIPRRWPGYQVDRRVGSSRYRIQVDNPGRGSSSLESLTLDGVALPGDVIPLVDDARDHTVVARLEPQARALARSATVP
jgi:cyclic beta-1,2-glucan synthetase